MEARQQQHIRHDIPKGAIMLSRLEALSHQSALFRNWKPQSDVWPLLVGRPILAGAAALTGLYINLRFRRKVKLQDYGLFPTIAGLTAGPTIATSLLYTEFVMDKMLLFEVPCSFCLESRSALLQTCTGVVLPLILAPTANFFIASGSGIFSAPDIRDVKGILRIVSSVYQPMIPIITTIFTLHVLLAGFITHSQIKSFLYILDVQNLIEQEEKEKKHTSNF